MRFSIRVPATSANLGPGFDSFGLALELWNIVHIDTDATGVTWEGEGAEELPRDGSDMISRAMEAAAEDQGFGLPAHSLHGTNAIPLERGLGSSSAAAVAGVAAAWVLAGLQLDRDEVFRVAAMFEGHPDNAAPAVYGGFTIVSDGPATRPWRSDPAAGLRPVLLIPNEVRLPTHAAREALPATVPIADAIFNAAHAAALAVAMVTGDIYALQASLVDRIHQDVRLALVPAVRDVFQQLRSAGIPVCVSGAGPTLLAFETDDAKVQLDDPVWTVVRPAPARAGVQVD